MNDRVAGIIARTLGVAPTSARLIAGGQSDVYAVSVRGMDDHFLKLARPGEGWRVAREAIVYPLLRCPRPTLVACDVDEGFLLTATAGRMSLARRFKAAADCSRQFRAMGRLLRQIHETPLDDVPPATRASLDAGRAEVERIVRRDAVGRLARAGASPAHAARFMQLVERVIALPGRALLHGDYNTRQVILDAAGDVAAVIDFEYACVGPPALDLLRMELSGIRGRDAFYAGYGRADVALPFDVLDALDAACGAADRDAAASRLHEAIERAG